VPLLEPFACDTTPVPFTSVSLDKRLLEGIRDLGSFVFKMCLDLEVKGIENLPKAGERVLIAPNHVSLLDAAILHCILPEHAALSIDSDPYDSREARA